MKLAAAVVFGFLIGAAVWAFTGSKADPGRDPHRSEVVARGMGADRPARRGEPPDSRASQAASRLIQSGKIYSLGRLYEHGMPLPGKRHFSLTIPGSPTGGPSGKNQGVYHDDLFSGEIGQIGTQLDGLGHVGVRIDGDDYFYNGYRRSQFGTAYGLEKLGIENVGVFFTRGVLLDVAKSRGVERMKVGDVITASDLEIAAKAQGVDVSEGDVVLIRTGHGQLWMKDNTAFSAGEPGIGVDAAVACRSQDCARGKRHLGDRGRAPGRPRTALPRALDAAGARGHL